MELKKWLLENYELDEIRDMYEHGCLQGFHGLTYYVETNKLYEEYSDDVWDAVIEQTYNESNSPFLKIRDVYCHDHFAQYMVWRAVEVIAETILIEAEQAA